MPTGRPEQVLIASSGPSRLNIGHAGVEDEQALLYAFRSFAEVAGSLEQSYGKLRAEVERLRRELEQSNCDLVQSLEENRRMRVHLDRILEGLPCGVLVATGDGLVSRANPEALRLLGMNSDGDPADLRSLSTLPAAVRQLLECARRSGKEQELCVPFDAGTARWLAARHASIAENATSASIYILRDVGEHKRLEEAQARLRREQALAEMSAILAHEVRNPLGSLELFAGLLAESDLNPDCRKWVEHMQTGLRTLAATVNNVLHFHSLPEPERAPVEVSRLLAWANDFFAPLARRSGVTLSLQDGASGEFIAADRHRLEQVLLNLMLNALRAMPDGGWIELAGRKAQGGQAVELAVADIGSGISSEDLPRIFEPGFSTRAGSPGLGLAVCRKIVEQHGGTIWATSSEYGTRFTLTFPITDGSTHGAME